MVTKEVMRLERRPEEHYRPDDAGSAGKRHQLMLDRASGTYITHQLGEPLETTRGTIAILVSLVANDIVDFERDVHHGETNNCLRSLSSEQQVVDGAGFFLDAINWIMDQKDYDLLGVACGQICWYAVYWRYNVPKIAGHYAAISVRDKIVKTPPEFADISAILQSRNSDIRDYGVLYDRTRQRVADLYGGCTCSTLPTGHELSKLVSQAFDDGGNDEIEEQMQAALLELSLGANEGDIRCECGMDLLYDEVFVRYFDPEEGIVARMHYRTGVDDANTLIE